MGTKPVYPIYRDLWGFQQHKEGYHSKMIVNKFVLTLHSKLKLSTLSIFNNICGKKEGVCQCNI